MAAPGTSSSLQAAGAALLAPLSVAPLALAVTRELNAFSGLVLPFVGAAIAAAAGLLGLGAWADSTRLGRAISGLAIGTAALGFLASAGMVLFFVADRLMGRQ